MPRPYMAMTVGAGHMSGLSTLSADVAHVLTCRAGL
jgi:hypothetical protein